MDWDAFVGHLIELDRKRQGVTRITYKILASDFRAIAEAEGLVFDRYELKEEDGIISVKLFFGHLMFFWAANYTKRLKVAPTIFSGRVIGESYLIDSRKYLTKAQDKDPVLQITNFVEQAIKNYKPLTDAELANLEKINLAQLVYFLRVTDTVKKQRKNLIPKVKKVLVQEGELDYRETNIVIDDFKGYEGREALRLLNKSLSLCMVHFQPVFIWATHEHILNKLS